MASPLNISALSQIAGVSPKTIRYWERVGLLPKAGRTHTGYRVFSPEAVQYVDFIKRSKSVGLTVAQMRHLLHLAQSGENPCPEVVAWMTEKHEALQAQIRSLQELNERLNTFFASCERDELQACKCEDTCSLVADLPLTRGKGDKHAKVISHRPAVVSRSRGQSGNAGAGPD